MLPINFKDITYLFVQSEEDIYALVKAIKNLKLNDESTDRLITKIITAKQIERDF